MKQEYIELLESAASACGYIVTPENWNPLANDQEAHEIARLLGIKVEVGVDSTKATIKTGDYVTVVVTDIKEAHGECAASATRLAIVRAASYLDSHEGQSTAPEN